MSDSDYLIYFEQLNIGEINNWSLSDFHQSFRKYFSCKSESVFYSGFIKDFGNIKFGEIENSIMNDFKKAFKFYFFEIP